MFILFRIYMICPHSQVDIYCIAKDQPTLWPLKKKQFSVCVFVIIFSPVVRDTISFVHSRTVQFLTFTLLPNLKGKFEEKRFCPQINFEHAQITLVKFQSGCSYPSTLPCGRTQFLYISHCVTDPISWYKNLNGCGCHMQYNKWHDDNQTHIDTEF